MKNKYFTLWLSLICIIVFVLQNILNGFTDLFVLNSSAIYGFQIWRFFSAIFLHGSLIHIMLNLFALVLFGLILENRIGSSRFLIVFLVSGIFANLVSVFFYSSSLGASGAIMGVIGCLTVIEPFMMVWSFGFPLPMFLAAIVWILTDIFGVLIPSDVANMAHLSGIVIGFIFGGFFRNLINRIKDRSLEPLIPEDYVNEWENRYIR